MFEKIKKKFLNKKFVTFVLIGIFNTVFSLTIYTCLIKANAQVGISSILGDLISMVFSYFLNMHYTYKEKPNLKSFLSFPLSYLPGVIVNMFVTVIMVDVFNAPRILAKAFSLPITIPLNFLMMSFIVKITKGNANEKK